MASGGPEKTEDPESCSLSTLPSTPTKQAVPKSPGKTPAGSPISSPLHSSNSSPCLNSSSSSCHGSPSSPAKSRSSSDRYIPNRLSGTRLQLSEYLLNSPKKQAAPGESSEWSETEEQRLAKEKQKAISRSLAGDMKNAKVLEFSGNKGRNPLSNVTRLMPKPSKRFLSSVPERILDAPNVIDDYYFNLLDWSSQGVVGVALSGTVYLWKSDPPMTHLLMQTFANRSCVSSLAFDCSGNNIAVGTSHSQLQFYDVATRRHLRTAVCHSEGRIGTLAWNANGLLASGCQDGIVCLFDLRQSQPVKRFLAHRQEVCGVSWSPNGRLLATGGADHKAHVWACGSTRSFIQPTPVLSTDKHRAAVKAVSWCPWRHQTLATGGGFEDGNISLWNTNNNSYEATIKVRAQICSLLWAPNYNELVAGLGTPSNCASVWKYQHPNVKRIKDLPHSGRVLSMALSPEKSLLATICGDECLRFWKCFPSNSKKEQMQILPSQLFRRNTIR